MTGILSLTTFTPLATARNAPSILGSIPALIAPSARSAA